MRRPPPPPLRWETARPPDTLPVAVAPARMAPLRGARPLKRWRYVAAFSEGDRLDLAAEAVRERHDHLVVVRSEYRQPFGTFAGSLPGVGPVSGALGVMEHHVARW